MALTKWTAICQWCGKRGISSSVTEGNRPTINPQVPGKCPSHPSGKKDASHGPKWEKG